VPQSIHQGGDDTAEGEERLVDLTCLARAGVQRVTAQSTWSREYIFTWVNWHVDTWVR